MNAPQTTSRLMPGEGRHLHTGHENARQPADWPNDDSSLRTWHFRRFGTNDSADVKEIREN